MKISELIKTQELAQAGVLYAPAGFLTATVEELAEICNSCGAAGSFFRPPSKIYGTDISASCNIHDYQYHYGRTIEDKWEADRIFHNNMNRLITRDSHKKHKPTWLQRRRALKYYYAVKCFGSEAYWKGKN